MEKLGFSSLDENLDTCDQKQTDLQESRLLSIERCIKFLEHAYQCIDENCRLTSCQKMKKLVQHARNCKQSETIDGCLVCKQLISLCCYHAKYCQEAKCPVPFCFIIKDKLKQQQLQHRRQQAQILKVCVATMQNLGLSNAVSQTSPGNSTIPSSLVSQPDSSLHPSQSRISMKSCTAPPVGALQAVQQVQATAARQRAPHMAAASVSYGKVNHVIIPPVANTGFKTAFEQMPKPILQTMSNVSNRMLNVGNVTCWEDSGYAHNSQSCLSPQPQSAPQLGVNQQEHIIRTGSMPNSIENSSMGPSQVMPNPEPTPGGMQKHTQIAWQQLSEALKSPSSPQQQKNALGILKSNPELTAMFIKQTAGCQNQQQQLQQQVLLNEGNMITLPPQNLWHDQQQQYEQQQQHLFQQQQQHSLQQQPNKLPHPLHPMYSKRPRIENPYEFS